MLPRRGVRRSGGPRLGAGEHLRRLDVRGPRRRTRRARRPDARSRPARAACCWCAARTACCGRSPTSAGTAATSCCRAASRPASGSHRLPVPRAGPTSSTARCATRPAASATSRASTSRSSGWSRSTSSSGTAGSSSTRPARAARSSEHVGGLEQIVANYRPEDLVTVASHSYELATQLEDHRRELPGVLPLLVDPPRAVPGQPAAERREPRPRRRLDRRLDGPDARRRHDVARRPQRRRRDRRADRRRAAHGDVRSSASPTC